MRVLSRLGLLFFFVNVAVLSSPALCAPWSVGGFSDPLRFHASWHQVRYEHHWDALPQHGSVANEHIPWGDSYWPLQRGGLAARWRVFREDSLELARTGRLRLDRYFDLYRPSREELLNLPPLERRKKILTLSPLEKFSLFIGDDSFGLADRFTRRTDAFKSSWQGYCHAWAPAALHYAEPQPVVRRTADGLEIDFGSSDVKAVLIAAYAEKVMASLDRFLGSVSRRTVNAVRRLRGGPLESPDAVFVGARCHRRFIYPEVRMRDGGVPVWEYGDFSGLSDSEYPERLRIFQEKAREFGYRPDGGPSPQDADFIRKAIQNRDDPACSDVNAGAFHLVLANQLGRMKEGFLIDKTRDVEVWNQPVFRFDSRVLGQSSPAPSDSSRVRRKLHVKTRVYYAEDTDHGWAWEFPTLAGLFGPAPGFEEEYRRYQSFLLRNGEREAPDYPEDILGFSDYEYWIELDPENRIVGGEWISFERPDFLWLFRKFDLEGAFARFREIYEPSPSSPGEARITFSAQQER